MARVLNIISTIFVVIVVALAVLLVGFRIIGFDTYVVISGSMEPAHKTGSLIYARDTDPLELEVGDVITFQSPGTETIVTHRVIEIQGEGYDKQFITKGDANAEADMKPVPVSNVTGKVAFSIPFLGYVANYIQNPPGLYFAAAGGVILIILMFLTDSLIEEDKKAKKRRAKHESKKEAQQ